MENSDQIFVEKNPLNKTLDFGMMIARKMIQEKFGIKSVYLGYNKLTKELFSSESKDMWTQLTGYPSIGRTSTMGFNLDEIKLLLDQGNTLYLCYFAIPIDDMDLLIENKNYEDWDVEEFITNIYKCVTVSVGSISFDEHKRCRTIKLILNPK